MSLRSVKILNEKVSGLENYPFSIPSIRETEQINFTSNVTFFVGENGSGKSTLLEAIAYQCGFNTAGGGRNNMYEVDALGASLGEYVRLSWMPKITKGFFLRAETFYNFATYIDTIPEALKFYGGKSLHRQSHGEAFLSLFMNRFAGAGIYLLDEPEAALSPARQLSFLRIMYDLTNNSDSQFIIASHSPILLGFPGAQIIDFNSSPVKEVQYEDTDHFQITKGFLNRRELFLSELFSDEGSNE